MGNRTPLSPALVRGISSYAIVGTLARMVFCVTYAALQFQVPVGSPDFVAIRRSYCVWLISEECTASSHHTATVTGEGIEPTLRG